MCLFLLAQLCSEMCFGFNILRIQKRVHKIALNKNEQYSAMLPPFNCCADKKLPFEISINPLDTPHIKHVLLYCLMEMHVGVFSKIV